MWRVYVWNLHIYFVCRRRCAYQTEQAGGNLPARISLISFPDRKELRQKNLFSVAGDTAGIMFGLVSHFLFAIRTVQAREHTLLPMASHEPQSQLHRSSLTHAIEP